MPTKKATTTTRNVVPDPAQARRPGTGFEPITLSTAILSGSGVRRAMGVASRLITKMAAMCHQKGRACRSRRL